MIIAQKNLTIDQGATATFELNFTDDNGDPVDLTGVTIRSQVRRSYTSQVSFDFDVVVVDPATALVKFTMPPTTTVTMKPGRYVYDAIYYRGDEVVPFLKGIVTVYPRVTR